MTTNTLTINGVSFADIVDKDQYHTEKVPVTRSLTTLDGVDHVVLLREKGVLTFGCNPMTAERYAALCAALSGGVVTVQYTDLQSGTVRTASMAYDTKAATHIPRCMAKGAEWLEGISVTMTEL